MENNKNSDIKKKAENKNNPAKKNSFRRTIIIGIGLFTAGLIVLLIVCNLTFLRYPFLYTTCDGNAEIIWYIGKGEKIVIPEYIAGKPVTGIWDNVLKDHEELVDITLPSTLKGIGRSAFYGCTGIEVINIPDNVEYIGEYAFQRCEKIKNIKIPESVTKMEFCVFAENISLETVELLSTNLSGGAFWRCYNLKQIILPEGIRYLEGSTFLNCSSLENIVIPSSVIEIGKTCFGDCMNLESISIPSSVQDISYDAFEGCDNLTIYCYKDTYAEQYAIDRGIPYIIITE